MSEKIYKGYRGPDWDDTSVMVCEPGKRVRNLKHLVQHSPTGLEWGYGGSGPADLARSILGDAIGNAGLSPALYQEFKRAFVARWSRDTPPGPVRAAMLGSAADTESHCEWRITEAEIQAWLEGPAADLYRAAMADREGLGGDSFRAFPTATAAAAALGQRGDKAILAHRHGRVFVFGGIEDLPPSQRGTAAEWTEISEREIRDLAELEGTMTGQPG